MRQFVSQDWILMARFAKAGAKSEQSGFATGDKELRS